MPASSSHTAQGNSKGTNHMQVKAGSCPQCSLQYLACNIAAYSHHTLIGGAI